MAQDVNAPAEILDAIGGPNNIVTLTHCATRLRFQLRDNSGIDGARVEAIPGVMGAVSQAGNRYQVVIGGAVEGVYNDIMALPQMKDVGSGEAGAGAAGRAASNADVKAAEASKGPRGRFSWLDGFFDYLGDSFRPILGALLGASLIITFMALMGTLGVIGNWADPRTELAPTWQFLNLAWRCVFYFLPLMVAYNASKKLGADPWVGFAVMAVVMLPGFTKLDSFTQVYNVAGSQIDVVWLFGGHLPLTIFDYGSQVFPPLLMAAVLGPLYKGLKRIISPNVQLIFVPFLSMLVMIPLTAFLIGPIGVFAGAGVANFLGAVNDFSPFIFAILIPMLYPFMVPLGLHWPLNAVMLLNIQNLGFDFIQGPMGAWNFACFGATAGVLILSLRDRDVTMRQTATGALVAGLLGGISEPSLYGIHLRFKRVYPRILVGCFLGGLVQGIGGGVTTNAFVFTSLLTIPAFSNIPLYAISVGVAFLTSMILVVTLDYRTPEQRAEAARIRAENDADEQAETALKAGTAAHATNTGPTSTDQPITGASAGVGTAVITAPASTRTAMLPDAITSVGAPLAGRLVPLGEVPDPVFAKGTVGLGVGIDPSGNSADQNVVVAPADGKIIVAQDTGHAFGIKLDSGIELLIHVGIDTVNLAGKGFDVKVARGDLVKAGDPLVTFDRAVIEAAGYSMITPVLVTNPRKFASVAQTEGLAAGAALGVGDPVITVTGKPAKLAAASAGGDGPVSGTTAAAGAPATVTGAASVTEKSDLSQSGSAQSATATPPAGSRALPSGTALKPGAVTQIAAPVAGTVIPLSEVPDAVFAKGIVGRGVGIDPTGNTITSPGAGKIIVAQDTGHAVGIKLDSGIELLIHVGIDTVNLAGKGFTVHIARGDRVKAGDPLVTFNRATIEAAGYSMITPVLVTNPKKFTSIEQATSGQVREGEAIITVTA